MSDFQASADRVEIEALHVEFSDAAMMRDYDRLASLFTPDGALRCPTPRRARRPGGDRAWGKRVRILWTSCCRTRIPTRSLLTAAPRQAARTRDGREGGFVDRIYQANGDCRLNGRTGGLEARRGRPWFLGHPAVASQGVLRRGNQRDWIPCPPSGQRAAFGGA